jgi:hypothetical protein
MNRWQQMQEIGCLACRQMGFANEPSDMHHLLSGHRRRGDEFTIPLCPWHHRGLWNNRFANQKLAEALLGPSLAHSSKRFRELFGSDDELLTWCNELIAAHKQTNWRPAPVKLDENGHLMTKSPEAPPAKKNSSRRG